MNAEQARIEALERLLARLREEVAKLKAELKEARQNQRDQRLY